jgi:hypothetical protein
MAAVLPAGPPPITATSQISGAAAKLSDAAAEDAAAEDAAAEDAAAKDGAVKDGAAKTSDGVAMLDQHPFDTAGIGAPYVLRQPVGAQQMLRDFDHDVIGVHLRVVVEALQALKAGGAGG